MFELVSECKGKRILEERALPKNIEVIFSKTYPSFLTVKEGSTFLTKPLFPQGREDVTALRCSEPLRYKVGGASKPSPCCAGWDRLDAIEDTSFAGSSADLDVVQRELKHL